MKALAKYLSQAFFLLVGFLGCTAAAQNWVGSSGTPDPTSLAITKFVNGAAYIRSDVSTGTVTLRYNVLPVGDLGKTEQTDGGECTQFSIRYVDNGSAAQVIAKIKIYDTVNGTIKTLLNFDSNSRPQQSGFQLATLCDEFLPLWEQCVNGECRPQAPFIEVQLIRSGPGGNPAVGVIALRDNTH